MHVEPATCPVCSASYDPLRSRSVAVLNGRVRAFCSSTCMERGRNGVDQAPSLTDSLAAIQPPPRWDRKSVAIACGVALVAVSLIAVAGHNLSTAPVLSVSGGTALASKPPPPHVP